MKKEATEVSTSKLTAAATSVSTKVKAAVPLIEVVLKPIVRDLCAHRPGANHFAGLPGNRDGEHAHFIGVSLRHGKGGDRSGAGVREATISGIGVKWSREIGRNVSGKVIARKLVPVVEVHEFGLFQENLGSAGIFPLQFDGGKSMGKSGKGSKDQNAREG